MYFWILQHRRCNGGDWEDTKGTETENETLARARYRVRVEEEKEWRERYPEALTTKHRLLRCEVVETMVVEEETEEAHGNR